MDVKGIGYSEVFLFLVLVYGLYKYWNRDPRLAHLPPHVRGWPIINQTLDQVKDNPILMIQKWAKDYGELMRTTSGTTTFIWINSKRAFKELIDRRSAIYSSRHPQPMVQRASGGKRMVFMPYGKDWRAIRNIIHRLLTPAMSKSYSPIQTFEGKQLSVDLLERPEDFYMHNRRYSASVIMQVVYGHRIPNWDCEEIRQIYSILTRFASFRRPGAYLIDVLPELEYLPFYEYFSSWKTVGDDIHKKDAAIFKQFWDRMKAEVAAGTAPHSWGKEFVQSDYEKHGIDELGAIYTAYYPRVITALTTGGQCALLRGQSNGRIEAGSETTAQVLNNTIVGLLSNPEAVRKSHEELDRVIGDDRTPTFADEPNLPYIRALVKETLRWRSINKLGQNHFVTEDDWYEGMFIPKDTIIMMNLWAIHYNEEDYPEPEKYKPERYLHHDLTAGEYAAHPDVEKRDHFSFGGGRRICPGLHIAERSIFLNLARLLWGFNIEHAKDENGNIIPVDFTTDGLVPGALSNPNPFKCSIKVRSPKRERLLRKEWAEAQKVGVDFSSVQFDKV